MIFDCQVTRDLRYQIRAKAQNVRREARRKRLKVRDIKNVSMT